MEEATQLYNRAMMLDPELRASSLAAHKAKRAIVETLAEEKFVKAELGQLGSARLMRAKSCTLLRGFSRRVSP